MGMVDRVREWCMGIGDLDSIVTTPSEICAHSLRTITVQIAFWIIVLSLSVSVVQGHVSLVTLAGTGIGSTIIAGVILMTVTDR